MDEEDFDAEMNILKAREEAEQLFKTIAEGGGTQAVEVPTNGKVVHVFTDDSADPLTNMNLGKFTDIEYPRLMLPSIRTFQLRPSIVFSLLRDLIGKDISKSGMPVYFNEPMSILQKCGEFIFLAAVGLKKAVQEPDSAKRLALIAIHNASAYFALQGRLAKPFNPLLGETYEMVTPDFRLVIETVCHHPPITVLHVEGDGYEMCITS